MIFDDPMLWRIVWKEYRPNGDSGSRWPASRPCTDSVYGTGLYESNQNWSFVPGLTELSGADLFLYLAEIKDVQSEIIESYSGHSYGTYYGHSLSKGSSE